MQRTGMNVAYTLNRLNGTNIDFTDAVAAACLAAFRAAALIGIILRIKITAHGPYGFTKESGCPLYTTVGAGREPGVYLWAVKLDTTYRVAYAGKSDGHLASRLWDEVQRTQGASDATYAATCVWDARRT